MGFRAIERVKNVHHTTIINWVKQAGELLPDCYAKRNKSLSWRIRWVTNICRFKKKTWRATAVDHFKPGILGWALGAHSAKTFEPLWDLVSKWNCYFYVTDGWKVYPIFVPEGEQIISKTYMTCSWGWKYKTQTLLGSAKKKNSLLF